MGHVSSGGYNCSLAEPINKFYSPLDRLWSHQKKFQTKSVDVINFESAMPNFVKTSFSAKNTLKNSVKIEFIMNTLSSLND